jgi:hypothetical protein
MRLSFPNDEVGVCAQGPFVSSILFVSFLPLVPSSLPQSPLSPPPRPAPRVPCTPSPGPRALQLGGLLIMCLPQVIVHEIDAWSPLMPPPEWRAYTDGQVRHRGAPQALLSYPTVPRLTSPHLAPPRTRCPHVCD